MDEDNKEENKRTFQHTPTMLHWTTEWQQWRKDNEEDKDTKESNVENDQPDNPEQRGNSKYDLPKIPNSKVMAKIISASATSSSTTPMHLWFSLGCPTWRSWQTFSTLTWRTPLPNGRRTIQTVIVLRGQWSCHCQDICFVPSESWIFNATLVTAMSVPPW